jgi:glycopeptide antibiotics resistance protein
MLRQLFYLFLPYRSFALPFLVASAIAVPCWLIFRVFRVRGSGRKVSFSREMLLLIFVVYLAGLAVATLSPNRSSRLLADGRGGVDLHPRLASLTCSSNILADGSAARGFCMHNARGNVMLFFPFGILIPLLWKRLRFWKALQIAIALSCGIELFQYFSSAWGSYRAADVNDVILNVIGASVGLALVSLARVLRGNRRTLSGTVAG